MVVEVKLTGMGDNLKMGDSSDDTGINGVVKREVPTTIPKRMTAERREELEKKLDAENVAMGYTEEDDTDMDDLIRSAY